MEGWKEGKKGWKEDRKRKRRKNQILIQALRCVPDNRSFHPPSPKLFHIPHEGIILPISEFMGSGQAKEIKEMLDSILG